MSLLWKSVLCAAFAALLASCGAPGPAGSYGRDVWGHRPGPKGFKTVIIDAGHGGKDIGAVSRHTRQREKDLNLDMAKRIRAELRGDFKTILMRSSDTFVDLDDRVRFANRYGVTLNQNPFFPINTLQLMRAVTAYQGTPQFEPLLTAIFNAMWISELNMGEPEIVGKVLVEAGFDPEEVMAKASDPAVKEQLKRATEEAIGRRVFGAPTCFVNGEMFFGQDRLDWIEAAARS